MFSRFVLAGLVAVLVIAFSEVPAQAEMGPNLPTSVSQQSPSVSSGMLLGQSSDDGSSTRIRGRSVRGLVKLVIFGGVLLIGGIGWVINQFSGGGE